MDAATLLNALLVLAIIFAVVALGVLFLRLKKTVDAVTSMVDDMKARLMPTLGHVEQLTNDLQPVVKKANPLMDRVNLTVDELNLELMRVDQLLSDLGDVTATASNAAGAVDTVTAAPAKLVTSVSDRFYRALNGKKTSSMSAQLAEAAEERVEEASDGDAADKVE